MKPQPSRQSLPLKKQRELIRSGIAHAETMIAMNSGGEDENGVKCPPNKQGIAMWTAIKNRLEADLQKLKDN